jgi:hypothetical protein
MSDESALLPLQQTHESIVRIKQTLDPFLSILRNYHCKCNNKDKIKKKNDKQSKPAVENSRKEIQSSWTVDYHKIIEAEAAVALAIGTLRFMAFRLKGQVRGKKRNDPLRMELTKMKEMLSQVQALRKEEDESSHTNNNDPCSLQQQSDDEVPSKRKRRLDQEETKEDNGHEDDNSKVTSATKMKTNRKTRVGGKRQRNKYN